MSDPKRIFIDGREHVVHGITSERAGWCQIAVAPIDDKPHLVHANHGVPSSWFHHPSGSTIRTSGHLYAHKGSANY